MNMISFISLLLLAMLGMATSIVLFRHLQKTKKQLDIEDVLERSGFNAKTTFYTVFKDATGMSPAAFRQALHGNVYDPEKPI